jgi:hypothetical protein
LIVYGDLDKEFRWITPYDLGTVNNGDISTLEVIAQHDLYSDLSYELITGKLPNGTKLLENGIISGRITFNTFVLDPSRDSYNHTTFDNDTTTFDSRFTFTVQTSNSEIGSIARKTFTVFVKRKYEMPTEELKFIAYPPHNDRQAIKDILNDKSVFPDEYIYRQNDPWFGKASNVVVTHAYSLRPSFMGEYANAMTDNHYRKQLILGEIKTAVALDDYYRPLYEVVYAELVDDMANENGSAALYMDWMIPITKFDFTPVTLSYHYHLPIEEQFKALHRARKQGEVDESIILEQAY